MSNGFSAADMSTAAANGHAEGYQAGYSDAVKAYEAGKPAAAQEAVYQLSRTDDDRAWVDCTEGEFNWWQGCSRESRKLFAAAPVAAAPGIDVTCAARIAELEAQVKELDRLCDATYVAQGADAYSHACDMLEQFQAARAAAGKEIGTEGSLCDGMAWLYGRLDELEAQIDANPKGGSMSDCPIIRLAPGEYTDWEKRVWRRGVIECATQSDIAAAMQATSAEVGA